MKKLVLSALSILLLAGCGGASNKVSKTCSLSVSGFDMEMKLDGEDNKLTNINATYIFPESLMGFEASEITAEQKTQVEDAMSTSLSASLGLDKDDFTYEFTDDELKVTLDIDVNNMSDELKSQLGLDEMSDFDATIKDLESGGATCK